MRADLTKMGPIQSSFLNIEKDTETILRKLFVESRPYSDDLKSLLIVNTPDCLDNRAKYQSQLEKVSLKDIKDVYVLTNPKIPFGEHEEVKSYIVIHFGNFTPNATNPQYRDCLISFDVICHTDYWDLGDYRIRPLKIIGYLDGILNECRLSGIGTLNFAGCNELLISPDLSGYTLTYKAIHGSDDKIPSKD